MYQYNINGYIGLVHLIYMKIEHLFDVRPIMRKIRYLKVTKRTSFLRLKHFQSFDSNDFQSHYIVQYYSALLS